MAQSVESWTEDRRVTGSRLTASRVGVVALSKTLYQLLSTGSTQGEPS